MLNAGLASADEITVLNDEASLTAQTETFFISAFIDAPETAVYEAELLYSGSAATFEFTAGRFTLTPDSFSGGDEFTVRIWVLQGGVKAYRLDVLITALSDSFDFPQSFYTAAAWASVAGAAKPAPVEEDGVLKFASTAQRLENIFDAKLVASVEDGAEYRYSFMLKSPDAQFVMRLFTAADAENAAVTGGAAADRNHGYSGIKGWRYDLTYLNGRFSYYVANQNDVNNNDISNIAYTANTAYRAGEWNRFDFVFTTLTGEAFDANNWDAMKTELSINGARVAFERFTGTTAAVTNPTLTRAAKIEEGNVYFRTGTGMSLARHFILQTADGGISENLLNAYEGEFDGRTATLCWLMDVTELRRNERELLVARDLAEESARAKSDFLANISHEIRTPMNAVIGLHHLLLRTRIDDQQRDYLLKSDSAARSLLRLINDILDFSKIEAGKVEIIPCEFHLPDMLKHAVDLVSTQVGEKGLEFILEVEPDTPVGLVGDDMRLLQVVNNLTSNAVKFTSRGEIRLTVEVVGETEAEAELRFTVRDTGIGLSPHQAAKLFSAFTQSPKGQGRLRKSSGWGWPYPSGWWK